MGFLLFLSVPGMRGLVPRYRQIRYQGRDQLGKPIDRSVSGFHARVVQHEGDHLAGILYPMRIRDLRNFGCNEELFPGQDLQNECILVHSGVKWCILLPCRSTKSPSVRA